MTMGDLSTLEVIIIAIVEGLTEFFAGFVYGAHDYYAESAGYREYGVCESLYGDNTVLVSILS